MAGGERGPTAAGGGGPGAGAGGRGAAHALLRLQVGHLLPQTGELDLRDGRLALQLDHAVLELLDAVVGVVAARGASAPGEQQEPQRQDREESPRAFHFNAFPSGSSRSIGMSLTSLLFGNSVRRRSKAFFASSGL